jgi:putative intracellular protease/amidase
LLGPAATLRVSAYSGRAALIAVATGVMGGLLHDVDHPDSTVGRWLPWPAVREGPCRVGRWRPGGVVWQSFDLGNLTRQVQAVLDQHPSARRVVLSHCATPAFLLTALLVLEKPAAAEAFPRPPGQLPGPPRS